MKSFTLPGTDIVAPNVVLGLMRIAEKSDDEIRELVLTARDAGINFVDHADVYGRELAGVVLKAVSASTAFVLLPSTSRPATSEPMRLSKPTRTA